MKMQDKELDELFRAHLDDLEVKPSAHVWSGINAGLDRKSKKAYIPFLSIAASIIILFTIGYLFIPRKAATNTKNTASAGIAKTSLPIEKSAPVKQVANISLPAKGKNTLTGGKTLTLPVVKQLKGATDADNDVGDTLATNNEQLAANIDRTEILQPVSPHDSIKIASLPSIQIKPGLTAQPQQTIAALPAMSDKSQAVKPRHPPLSLGGIINAMVARVDKRQDKIIEFTDDDGESNITGINLGIIKLKKDQRSSEK